MPSVNKCFIMGHLGRDPEVKYSQEGTAFCTFSLATSDKYKDKERTDWHYVTAFGKTAELCGQFLHKGACAFIEGRVQYREYEDREGAKRKVTNIIADRVTFVSTKRSQGAEPQGGGERKEPIDFPPPPEDPGNDDLQF